MECGIGSDLLVDCGKVPRDPRAKLRQRAARIDKGYEQRLALELRKVNCPPVLIRQLEVRHRIARSRDVLGNLRTVIRLALRDNDDMVEQNIGVRILRNQQVGGNHVAGMQLAEDVRILQFVGHGHRIHEARNRVMIQRDFAFGCVRGDHFPVEFVYLVGRIGGGIRTGLWTAVAPGEH